MKQQVSLSDWCVVYIIFITTELSIGGQVGSASQTLGVAKTNKTKETTGELINIRRAGGAKKKQLMTEAVAALKKM